MQNIAVLRDNQDGQCWLVPATSSDEFDTDRLAEGNLEIAGWLDLPEQYNDQAIENDEYERQPMFTTCEMVVDPSKPQADGSGRFCDRLILIINDGAPEFCTEHEEEE